MNEKPYAPIPVDHDLRNDPRVPVVISGGPYDGHESNWPISAIGKDWVIDPPEQVVLSPDGDIEAAIPLGTKSSVHKDSGQADEKGRRVYRFSFYIDPDGGVWEE